MNRALSTDLNNRSKSAVSFNRESSAQSYVHNRVTKSQKPRRKQRARSERARERLETKRHLIALANDLAQSAAAGRLKQRALTLAGNLARCHRFINFLTCGRHVGQIMTNFACEFRLCPNCARRRSRKIINKHLLAMSAFVAQNRVEPVHLTLTQKHRDEPRKRSVKRLRDAFAKLQRRTFWKEHFKGGICSLEFTKGNDGLPHAHLHIIAFRTKFFDVGELRDEWRSVTGDSHVFRIDRIADLEKGLLEVVKYISKPADIARFDKSDLAEFLEFRGMRFFGTFGEYRKFSKDFEPSDNDGAKIESEFAQLVEGCACPHCEDPLFQVRLSEDELPDFLQKVEASARSNSPPNVQ